MKTQCPGVKDRNRSLTPGHNLLLLFEIKFLLNVQFLEIFFAKQQSIKYVMIALSSDLLKVYYGLKNLIK